jgi:hypothetical protein
MQIKLHRNFLRFIFITWVRIFGQFLYNMDHTLLKKKLKNFFLNAHFIFISVSLRCELFKK